MTPLFAVHISDGILQSTWLAGGFVVAGFIALLGAWRVRDEEIPRIALLTAAFSRDLTGEVVSKRIAELCIIETLYINYLLKKGKPALEQLRASNDVVSINKW